MSFILVWGDWDGQYVERYASEGNLRARVEKLKMDHADFARGYTYGFDIIVAVAGTELQEV